MTAPALACQVCGVAATGGPVTRRTSRSAVGRAQAEYEVTTCEDCLSLNPDAPGLAVRAALRLLGVKPPAGDEGRVAELFEDAGVNLVAVLYDSGGNPRGAVGPQRKAWDHVDREGKALLRKGWAAVLQARVAEEVGPLRPVPPPEGMPQACVACGLATSVDWYEVTTGALTRGPGYVTGCLCDECGPVRQEVGATGQPFLEKAVMRAKGIDWVPRVWAWVATGLPPQAEPWSWVSLDRPEQAPDWGRLSQIEALQIAVADLTAKVADLEARL